MFNYGEIIKKAFYYTKDNRSLWIFGFVLALFSGGGASFPNGLNFNSSSGFKGKSGSPSIKSLPKIFPSVDSSSLVTVLVIGAIAIVSIVLFILFMKSLSRGALINMVKDLDNKADISAKAGFKDGFSYAMPIIAITIVVAAPAILISLILGAVLVGPGIVLIIAKQKVIGIIITVFGGLIFMLLLFVLTILVTIMNRLAPRFYIIEEVGIIESVKNAYTLIKQNLGQSFLLWLINMGFGLGQGIIMILVVIVTLVILALVLVAPIVALAIFASPWFLVLLVVPFAIFIIFVSFVGGIFQTYFSAYWTLAFKELNKAGTA